jgi:ketosteroid isomerase-like protein
MATPSRELAQRAYDAMSRRDLEAFLEVIHPEVEFTSLFAEVDNPGRFRGHAGVREWWAIMEESLGGVRFELQRFEEMTPMTGYICVWASGEAGGVEVGQTMWQAYRADGESIVWWEPFRTEQEAREAAEKMSA